jgi:hypothetical protein
MIAQGEKTVYEKARQLGNFCLSREGLAVTRYSEFRPPRQLEKVLPLLG